MTVRANLSEKEKKMIRVRNLKKKVGNHFK